MEARICGAGILLAAVALCLGGCERTAPAEGQQQQPPPEVTVAEPVVRDVTDYYEFPGQTAAINEVEIRSQVIGYITKVCFEDGQLVSAGDLLFEIDHRPFEAAIERAKGEVARLEALMAKAELDRSRADRLGPTGAISSDEYEQHKTQVEILKGSIQSAKAALSEANLNLDFAHLASPIKGRVSCARFREGNLVRSGNDSPVLTTVVTIDPIYISFNIEEPALLKYREICWGAGNDAHPDRIKELKIPVEAGLGNEQGYPFVGTLGFVDNKVDPKTGTIRVRGVFGNASQRLSPGQYVRVRVPVGKPHRALLITERAIGTDQGQKFVLAVNKDNVVEYRKVKLGSLKESMRVIESGIDPGERIIVKGLQRARPGKPVQASFETKKEVAASGRGE